MFNRERLGGVSLRDCAHTGLTPGEELAAHTLPGASHLNWDEFPPIHQQLAEAAETFLGEAALQRAVSRLSLCISHR